MAADVSDEIDSSAQAIAEFVEDLGKAVATGQKALDENTAKVAEFLSKTLVEIPAMIQEVLHEDTGLPLDARVTRTKVPMSTIILPTAYNFSRVYFQADLRLEEFNKSKGVKLKRFVAKTEADVKVQTGLSSLVSGTVSGGASGSVSTREASSRTDDATDRAAALLHFEATLEPRREIQVPAPLRSRIGPRVVVAITQVNIVPMVPSGGANNAPFTAERRTATASITVFKSDGTPNTTAAATNIIYTVDAKDLVVTSGGVPQNNTPLVLTVVRVQGAESQPLGGTIDTVLRVTLGGITEQIPLRL